MKQKNSLLFIILVSMALLLTACAGSAEPTPGEAPAAKNEAAFTVDDTAYLMSELEGMKTITVPYEGKDGTVEYTGVPVMDLLADAGVDGEMAVFLASDGYEAEVSLAELEDCSDCIVAFDDGELRMVLPGFPGNVQVKDVVKINGK